MPYDCDTNLPAYKECKMKGASDIILAIQELKRAKEHFDSFSREYPGTKGAVLTASYSRKIQWILKDLITTPEFPTSVVEGIRAEINSDVFTTPAITEKIAKLNPEQREAVEAVIDSVLAGKSLTVEYI